MPSSLLAEARHDAACAGLNLFGVVDVARFDNCQPKDLRIADRWPRCGTVLVIGIGGTAAARQPCDCQRDVAAIAARLRRARLEFEVVSPVQRLVGCARLAEAAGFGTISPVTGLLLHPEFGPWIQVCAVLLFAGRPFGAVADASITDAFQPCCSCRQPCRDAGLAAEACPVGTTHRHRSPWLIASGAPPVRASLSWFGIAVTRLLPRFLRP